MSSNELVSILIPNYNKENFLCETLDSIRNQNFLNWECIVVDDHSTDDSWKILKKYSVIDSRFKIYKRPYDLPCGASSCRNYAFKLSKGELIQWFDSDDLMLRTCLSDKVHFFNKFPNIDFVVSYAEIKIENNFIENEFKQNFEFTNLIFDYLKFKIQFLVSGPLFPRYIFDKVGLFNLNLKRHQEWELFLRVILNYSNFKVLNSFGFIYRINNDSITSKYSALKKIKIAELKVFNVILCDTSNPFISNIPRSIQNYFAYKEMKISAKLLKFNYTLFFLKVLIFNKFNLR